MKLVLTMKEHINTEIEAVLAENRRRNAVANEPYDPITGEGCTGVRKTVTINNKTLHLPQSLIDEVGLNAVESKDFALARARHDFEYWAAKCVKIIDKESSRLVSFVLNAPQRRLLAVMEGMRLSGRPVRVILLKARQWGGSTLVQMYLAWLQLVVRRNWNSVIVGHLRQTAAAIKAMYSRMLRHYPKEMCPDGKKPSFEPFEGSVNIRRLEPSGSLVVMGSAMSEDAVRGYDMKLAHLSEVAFWKDSAMHSPDDVMRAVLGTVPRLQDTVVVLESTADGVGSFFHRQWLEAKSGGGGYQAVFVPWHEIPLYSEPVDDPVRLWTAMDDYEHALWDDGLTLEQIQWYHNKRREYSSHALMKAEFPGNDIEAFATTGYCVFELDKLDRLREQCRPPQWQGEIVPAGECAQHGTLSRGEHGPLKIWTMPADVNPSVRDRYMVVVDVGGRSDDSDFSVIAVFDTKGPQGMPEVVAQWRGHIDHDRLAWKAVQIANLYQRALLVIESNTLETHGTMGVTGDTLLNEIANAYNNIYRRNISSPLATGKSKPGFHTNVNTKSAAITTLIFNVREGRYIERDLTAVDEMETYEQRPGSQQYSARRGCHDDVLMTRAIALLVHYWKTKDRSVESVPLDFMNNRFGR